MYKPQHRRRRLSSRQYCGFRQTNGPNVFPPSHDLAVHSLQPVNHRLKTANSLAPNWCHQCMPLMMYSRDSPCVRVIRFLFFLHYSRYTVPVDLYDRRLRSIMSWHLRTKKAVCPIITCELCTHLQYMHVHVQYYVVDVVSFHSPLLPWTTKLWSNYCTNAMSMRYENSLFSAYMYQSEMNMLYKKSLRIGLTALLHTIR